MRLLTTLIGLGAIVSSNGCFYKDVPVAHKLADCTNSTLRFQLTVQDYPPYQFVLGMPQGSTNQLSFRGDVIVSQSTRTLAKVQIGSDTITPCNWLPGHSGYILTWNRTNQAGGLNSFLTRGQTYAFEVQFSEPPSPDSSFWFSAMGKAGF